MSLAAGVVLLCDVVGIGEKVDRFIWKKGSKVFDFWTKQFLVSQNISFVENYFPYQIPSSQNISGSRTDDNYQTALDIYQMPSSTDHKFGGPGTLSLGPNRQPMHKFLGSHHSLVAWASSLVSLLKPVHQSPPTLHLYMGQFFGSRHNPNYHQEPSSFFPTSGLHGLSYFTRPVVTSSLLHISMPTNFRL